MHCLPLIKIIQSRSRLIEKKKIKTYFFICAGLRHSVPSHLKTNGKTPTELLFTLLIDNKEFDVLEKKSGNYRPFPSSPQPPFQSEARCEVFVMKIIHIEIETDYHNKNFALRLALKERLWRTRKWPIPY